MSRTHVGSLLCEWRHRRRRSQMDLALDAGVSTRHLSYVETGRSRPSPELLLALADRLEVPLRERNALLLAAGYAPRYEQTPLADESMAHVRTLLQRVLDAHDPYPGVAIDRQWNVMLANRAATMLTEGLPAELLAPELNVFRLCLHPDGLAARTVNFAEWAAYLLTQLHRTLQLTGDPTVVALVDEVEAYPNVAALNAHVAPLDPTDEPRLYVPFTYEHAGVRLSMFTTLTTFGTPRDITLDELSIELFYPADGATDELLTTGGPS